jgi:hypothetical protein
MVVPLPLSEAFSSSSEQEGNFLLLREHRVPFEEDLRRDLTENLEELLVKVTGCLKN